ncbi:MAG TPA: hypothetical protein VN851_02085 [Thermoanaerobaculia bacterium]|nr:hypothetical protein [Thermoanaerobaculia bacterium]
MTDSFISGAMALSVDAQGNFTIDHEPQGSRFRFSTSSHQATIGSFGTYVLTITTGFTLGDPAITFTDGQPADVEISDLGSNSFTLKIFASRDSTDFPQKIGFQIHSSDPDADSIVDPTILVDPPHTGQGDEIGGVAESGTLILSVSTDKEAPDQLVYKQQVVDTALLKWSPDERLATVSGFGLYYLVFGADFVLKDPAIDFPEEPESKPPPFVTLRQTSNLAILEIEVKQGAKEQKIPLRLQPENFNGGNINEPTILVDPPHGNE